MEEALIELAQAFKKITEEVFNYGYEQDKAEECEFFLEIEVAKG